MNKISLSHFLDWLLFRKISRKLPDSVYLRVFYYAKMRRKLHLRKPVTFNEKIQWLKLNDRKDTYTVMVDKYKAKEWVETVIGSQYIIPTIGVWDKFDEIDINTLPNQFVLKCTHDSGGLAICRNKESFNMDNAKHRIEESLNNNFFWIGREWPYKNVIPRIICEKYMGETNDSLTDYKFFCFHGKAMFIYVSKGLEDHRTARMSFYDLNGKEMDFYRSDYQRIGKIDLPSNFREMIAIANKIAKSVRAVFVRIDLYSVNNRVYFSEVTFSPNSGVIPFIPKEADSNIGELIDLERVNQ